MRLNLLHKGEEVHRFFLQHTQFGRLRTRQVMKGALGDFLKKQAVESSSEGKPSRMDVFLLHITVLAFV